MTRYIFRKVCTEIDLNIRATSVSLTLDLLPSKLLYQLLLTWVSSALSLNVVRCYVIELTVSMGLTDGRTDGTGVMWSTR